MPLSLASSFNSSALSGVTQMVRRLHVRFRDGGIAVGFFCAMNSNVSRKDFLDKHKIKCKT